MNDYYQILGVEETASNEEIKKSYRTLAKKYHPDAVGNNEQTRRRFDEITLAYETLGDEEKRIRYDADRGRKADQREPEKPGMRRTQSTWRAPENYDFSGAFNQFFGSKPGGKKEESEENPTFQTDELFSAFFKPKNKKR